MNRLPDAVVGAASSGQDLKPRQATFWFRYNWDTRRKQVFTNDDPTLPNVEANGEWDRLYLIQSYLPVPALLDQRQVIDLTATARDRTVEPLPAGRPIAYSIGHHLMLLASETVPISPDNPLTIRFETRPDEYRGKLHYPEKTSFTMTTHGRKVRVTIEEIQD